MKIPIRTLRLPGGLVLLLAASWALAAERTQDFSRDPGWIGARNRVVEDSPVLVRQNFGWSKTHHANGSGPGELGGSVYRSVRPAYYAKRLKTLTLNDTLSCSGTVAVTQWDYVYGWQSGSSVFAGFFNSTEQGWRPPNFMGFRIEAINDKFPVDAKLTWDMLGLDPKNPPMQSPRPSNPLVYVVNPVMLEFTYGTAAWIATGGTPPGEIHADGRRHTWRIDYDPKGGDGFGAINSSWDGGKPVTAKIPERYRLQGATFDRFGIFNYQQPGGKMDVWFDDITINGQREDFTADPRWEGKGNRDEFKDAVQYGIQDFGYSGSTNHAGSAQGELGGRFWRTDPSEKHYQGNYGDDIGRLTMNDRLVVRGKICVPRFSIDSGMHFGWYNSKQQGWPPKNFVGAYYDSETDTGRVIMPMYGTSEAGITKRKGKFIGAERGKFLLLPPDGRPRDFMIVYDPTGNGSVTLTIDQQSDRIELAPGHKAQGAQFDRFGMFNMMDDNGKECLVYLDDLTYTVGENAPRRETPPISLGGERHLFIDPWGLSKVEGVTFQVNPPVVRQVVIEQDKPWENLGGYSNVIDDGSGVYKLYYLNTHPGGAGVGLATSEDGVKWTKPILNLIDVNGSKENNLVMEKTGSGSVYYDTREKNPEYRYKYLTFYNVDDKPNTPTAEGIVMYTSPDGMRWKKHEFQVYPYLQDSQAVIFFDHYAEKYVCYFRGNSETIGRHVMRGETDDPMKPWPYTPNPTPYFGGGHELPYMDDKELPIAMARDESDPPQSDLYGNQVFLYPWAHRVYFAFPTCYYQYSGERGYLSPTPGNVGVGEGQIAVSRDGKQWTRYRRPAYLKHGWWGDRYVGWPWMFQGMIRRGDKIYQYGNLRGSGHGGIRFQKEAALGYSGVVLFEQTADRFVAAEFAYEGGRIVTEPIVFRGKHLVLNVDAGAMGEGRVGLLRADGTPIPGFTIEDCGIINGDWKEKTVSWWRGEETIPPPADNPDRKSHTTRKSSDDVSALAGQPIRIEFEMRGTRLYAMQFTDE